MKVEYDEESLKKITSAGMLGYDVDKIINVFDIDPKNEKQFRKDFNNKKSEVAKAYKKGQDKGEYVIDIKLFNMAKEGDLQALEKYEQRKIKT